MCIMAQVQSVIDITRLENCLNPVTILLFCLAEELKKIKATDDEEETLQQVWLLIYFHAQGSA